MRRVSIYLASIIGGVAASNLSNAQQAVVLKAIGVNDCAIGLPTPGLTGSSIAIATDINGHLCLSDRSQSTSEFAADYPSFGTAIGVKDVTGTFMTYLRADASNNLYTTLAGVLPAFASPPAVSQSGAWNVGLIGTLPAFAIPPAVTQSGIWRVGSEGVVYVGPLGSAGTYSGTSTVVKAIGGLQTLAVFSSDGGGGILSHIGAMFDAGQTTSVTVFLFRANPTSSICTDNATFVLDSADRSKLILQPITISPQDIVGITESYDGVSLGISVKNADGTPTQNLYVCAVTSSSLALSGAGLRLAIGVDQN